jgi:hypothetical protein
MRGIMRQIKPSPSNQRPGHGNPSFTASGPTVSLWYPSTRVLLPSLLSTVAARQGREHQTVTRMTRRAQFPRSRMIVGR